MASYALAHLFMKIVKTGRIESSRKAVFKGLTGIIFFRKELFRLFSNAENPRIQYELIGPFEVGKSIFLLAGEPILRCKAVESNPPEFLKIEMSGNKKITEMLGIIVHIATLEASGNTTQYACTYETSEEPPHKMSRFAIGQISFFLDCLYAMQIGVLLRTYKKMPHDNQGAQRVCDYCSRRSWRFNVLYVFEHMLICKL